MNWVELQVLSNFSFLRGASHPEEYVFEAVQHGYKAIAVTDLNTFGGTVRAHVAAKAGGIRFIAGVHLRLGALSVLAYPASREGYAQLCTLLTLGNRRGEKGECILSAEDFLNHARDVVCILIPPCFDALQDREIIDNDLFWKHSLLFKETLPEGFLSIAFTRNYDQRNICRLEPVKAGARASGLPLVAVNDIYYHAPDRKPLQDVLTCIRNKCTVEKAGFLLLKNSDRHLKDPSWIAHLYRAEPEAVRRTLEIEEMTRGFSLDDLKYEYPDEICPEGKSPLEYLRELTWEGAEARYPGGVSEKVTRLLDQEFALIEELGYEKYFLTCHDIVRFARSKGILCQGRGAAANSAVCFCLGITSVDPEKIDILFARFVSKERNEPPDIDIDFEHERREEVIQYIYSKYGRHRAGLTAEVITCRHRSAIRDVGKALGLSLEIVDRLAKGIHRWTECVLPEAFIRELGLDPGDRIIRNALVLSRQIFGFPRHLSQHVGGFIISLRPLSETVPILNAAMPDRTIIEWDKDDIEELGMLKIDVLGLGMLTCIRKALELVNERRMREGREGFELHTIPSEDPGVYDMLCESDSVGVFQVESRAQMSMLPRLKPRCFYDLVIEVAIVRPGPIHGDMVHPFLRRRAGDEPVSFPDDEVKEILGKTLGVPLFQEQAMRLAIVLAQFTPGEAERLRRAMAAWKKNKALIDSFRLRIVKGMTEKGYTARFAETCVNQIKGFSEYGFPESHAASFALLVYASAWLKRYYPVEYACALLNSQPMGFYSPSQIVQDLEAHGYTALTVDVNSSGWDCRVEDGSLRLGMRLIRGMRKEQGLLIESLVKEGGETDSVRELWLRAYERKAPLRKYSLIHLAEADAFQSLGLTRRDALWEIKGLPDQALPLDPFESINKENVTLEKYSLQESMFQDYSAMGLSLKAHPVSFIRDELTKRRAVTAKRLAEIKKGADRVHVSAAGMATVRQRPRSANGVVFITLEDETGNFNLIIRPKVFDEYSSIVLSSSCLLAHGLLEKVGRLSYINVQRLESMDEKLFRNRDIDLPSRSYSY